jgi:hypothetical protein
MAAAAPRIPAALLATALLAAAAMGASALLAACGAKAPAPGPSPVALVVTPSKTADPAAYRGAEALASASAAASAASAGRSRAPSAPYAAVRHAVLPDAPTAEARAKALETLLLGVADDPLVRAVLVVPAGKGAAQAFRGLRARRHDLVLMAAEPADDRLEIESAVDLVVELDRLYRPYFAATSARDSGARWLVEASPKGTPSPAASRERAVLRAACGELGLEYVLAEAGPGQRGGAWLGGLGPDSAVYCSDAALADAAIKAALASGAAMVDGGPESLDAYYRVLAPLLPGDALNADAAKRLKLLERAAVAAAGRGRLSTWTRGYAAESVEGLGEFARRVVLGTARVDDLKGLVAALEARSPGSAWIAAYDADPGTGVKAANHVLLRQDPYAFGRGYAQSAVKSMPAGYLALEPSSP